MQNTKGGGDEVSRESLELALLQEVLYTVPGCVLTTASFRSARFHFCSGVFKPVAIHLKKKTLNAVMTRKEKSL